MRNLLRDLANLPLTVVALEPLTRTELAAQVDRLSSIMQTEEAPTIKDLAREKAANLQPVNFRGPRHFNTRPIKRCLYTAGGRREEPCGRAISANVLYCRSCIEEFAAELCVCGNSHVEHMDPRCPCKLFRSMYTNAPPEPLKEGHVYDPDGRDLGTVEELEQKLKEVE